MALDLSTLTPEKAITAFYIGYYERAADPEGLAFWVDVLENTSLDLAAIASDFASQQETLDAHPFFSNPTEAEAGVFIAELYLNLFERADVDAEGLEFWTDVLLGSINGTNDMSVGEIIIAIISGAQDTEAGNDRSTILNKIDVAAAFTAAASDAGVTSYAEGSDVLSLAKSIVTDVTDDAATVAAATGTIDGFFEPVGTPGETFALRVGVDALTGTADDDLFVAQIAQSEFVGGISNTLATGDIVDGGAGNDRMVANVTSEFAGTNLADFTDIHALIKNVEEIDIRATDFADGSGQEIVIDGGVVGGEGVYFNGILGHKEIGSYFSDGDLKIENLTTYDANGVARNTSEITIAMDHTDNFNSDGDASDLTVLFDNDYLLSGETSVGIADFFLLDQDAELRILRGQAAEGRLDEIDKNGIRFEINGVEVTVEFDGALLDEDSPEEVNSHDAFIQALQADLAAKIADGTLPAGTTIERFDYPAVLFDDDGLALNRAGLQDGSFSDLIPSIQVTSGDGSPITPLGFTAPDEITGEFNIFGRFDEFSDTADQPISIDIDLHKAGRGGEGGDLIVGGKANNVNEGIAGGIEVFNISVKGVGGDGADAKPSNVGTITSTLGALKTVNIVTDPMFAQGDSFASLVVRNGFDEDTFGNTESGDLQTVNANGFLGNLTLGDVDALQNAGRITNLDTLNALGGGDVEFNAYLNGNETNQEYNYSTGSGDDIIDVIAEGDALDYADSGLRITSGAGDDDISVVFNAFGGSDFDNNQLNQAIIDDVVINGESGDDTIEVDGVGVANILGGSGNDVIYTDGTGATAQWAFNYDEDRGTFPAGTDGEDLPGVQPSLAYIGGATITITLSGAGGSIFQGGGVMTDDIATIVGGEAQAFENGYEVQTTITELLNGNTYYGDQRDVNLAVIEAINNDAVLKHLLFAELGANNTLVVTSLTSGDFNGDDLSIDIAQAPAGSLAYANSVLDEAQAEFNDSSLTLIDLWDEDTDFDPAVDYQDTGAGADITDSVGADEWYTGLGNASDDPTAATLIRFGNPDFTENDNVIDGGDGNDLIVLSTDADEGFLGDFEVSSQNALINGASNETVVMTGNFGNDTVMNFTTTIEGTGPTGGFSVIRGTSFELGAITVTNDENTGLANPTIGTFVVIDGVLSSGEALEVFLPDGLEAPEIISAIVDAINNNSVSVSATIDDGTVPGDTIVLSGFDVGGVSFTVEDRILESGLVVRTFDEASLGVRTDDLPVDIDGFESDLDAGLDFLDFTAYLTSLEDTSTSTAATDSADSNLPILTTLEDNALAVAANEVAVLDEAGAFNNTDETTETFANLSESVIEQLFNNDATYDGFAGDDATYGSFNAGNFSVADYDKTATDEELIGNAKAILMVENADNLGEYKVFELTWDGDEDLDEQTVDATAIGSIDFGASLVGLAEVNLVGSDAYNTLLETGFAIT